MCPDSSPYAVRLAELEAAVRVPVDRQVEQRAVLEVRDLDPGLPHPDREWFLSGG